LRKFIIIFGLFALCACDHLEQDSKDAQTQAQQDAKTVQSNVGKNVMRVANNVRDSIKMTNEHIRAWWITPLPSTEKQPTPTRYCYRVLQDILCYREQMVGWESKLVAYQGTNATPPTPPTMQALPLRAENATSPSSNKMEKAKPFFVTMPTDAKESKTNSSVPTSADGEHETLPDTPLAPQL
jgi:hypothetical protein